MTWYGRLRSWMNRLLGDVGIVFFSSILLIGSFMTVAAVYPDETQRLAQKALNATTKNFGWLYLLTSSGFVIYTLGLASHLSLVVLLLVFLEVARFANLF
jgi:glycine betaine transporter